MIKTEDIANKRFGKLTTTSNYILGNHGAKLECFCDCGKKVWVRRDALLSGHTKSCGCGRSGLLKTHGLCSKDDRLYNIYNAMIHRCYHKNCNGYKYYGARGICVCDEWLNNINSFFDFAYKNGYDETKTIDRINSNGNYCPENCRFISKKLNSTRACFKRWRKYDPTDEELEIIWGFKDSI